MQIKKNYSVGEVLLHKSSRLQAKIHSFEKKHNEHFALLYFSKGSIGILVTEKKLNENWRKLC